jgi:hypothetical protein
MSTISGTLKTILDVQPIVGGVEVALCGYGNTVPQLNGAGLAARVTDKSAEVGSEGTFSFELTGNDKIQPDGTYYTIIVRDDNGDAVQINAYRFLDDLDYDLDDADPIDPDQPAPAGGIYVVPISFSNTLFDNNKGTGQSLTLTHAVAGSTAINFVQGAAVPFIIKQDATGGRIFVWPPNFFNPPGINPAPNGVTTSLWYLSADGNFYQQGAAVWI